VGSGQELGLGSGFEWPAAPVEEQHILRLEVAVHDGMVVDGREPRECHAQDLAHISLRVALPFVSRLWLAASRVATCAAVSLHHLRAERSAPGKH
jgi:hypothetical protein